MQQNIMPVPTFFSSTIFRGDIFSRFQITRENSENEILAKISAYTVYGWNS